MIEAQTQINYMQDGRLIVGAYPDPAMQAAIENQDGKSMSARANFQATVDINNLNDTYADELGNVASYFAAKDLKINPIRVVTADIMNRAYAITGVHPDKTIESAQGRNIHGRAIVVEDAAIMQHFGTDYILGIGLHEAAHSLSGNRVIKTVHGHGNRVSPRVIATGGLIKADLRRNTETKMVGDFWEEAFADLTRVKALRELGRSHTMTGEAKVIPMDGVTVSVAPSDVEAGQPNIQPAAITLPAEYAMLALTSETGRNKAAVTSANFAAYALGLLDKQAPGLYDDLEAATQDPKRQADAIRKIENVQPGLYRQLRELEYTTEDFVHGLNLVMDAISANVQSIPQHLVSLSTM